METSPKSLPLTRAQAHALVGRLLTDSRASRRQAEEAFRTNPRIQATLIAYRQAKANQPDTNATI
jgi:hypothetical protein